jgi:hypothetical protein
LAFVSGKDEDFPELCDEDSWGAGFAAFVMLPLSDAMGDLGSVVVVEA